jgi:hypothetical protein
LERRRTEVGYAKTPDGLEVDFLARYLGGGEELIQVCADCRWRARSRASCAR